MQPFLRGTPPRDLADRVEEDQARLSACDKTERMTLLGRIGDGCRMLGRLEEADSRLTEALSLARELQDEQAELANLIRLGIVHQYSERHEKGSSILRNALDRIRSAGVKSLEEFALQHLGKCLAEQDQVPEAIICFEEALSIREENGDKRLIQSTKEALQKARLWLHAGGDNRRL